MEEYTIASHWEESTNVQGVCKSEPPKISNYREYVFDTTDHKDNTCTS